MSQYVFWLSRSCYRTTSTGRQSNGILVEQPQEGNTTHPNTTKEMTNTKEMVHMKSCRECTPNMASHPNEDVAGALGTIQPSSLPQATVP